VSQMLANRYELMEKIGEGGMAVVYKTRCTFLDRWVAIKILRDQYANNPEFVDRFQREARAAARLAHPNIVSIYDVGEDQGRHFIVMEYVQGENLKDYLSRRGPLTPQTVAEMGQQVAAALAHAHCRGIIHRDIKPHNLLVSPEGQVKVTDFGIARAAAASSLTETGVVLGSVHYFSPEQAQGGAVDARSDIYALGVVLYELLTGEPPFTGDSPIAIALSHLDSEPPAVAELCPHVPEDLEQAIMKAMAKDPAHRYQTAGELNRALAPAASRTRAQEEPTRVLTAVPGREKATATRNRPKPNRRSTTWVVATILLLSVLTGAFLWFRYYFLVPIVEVPPLLGLQVEDARLLLAEKGLDYYVLREVYSEEEAGVVVDQEPKPSSIRKSGVGEKVGLIVSKGRELAQVPDVRGQTQAGAAAVLAQKNLEAGTLREEYDPVTPVGLVLGQEPAPRTQVPAGTKVALVLSLGPPPQPVVVPDLAGKDLAVAQSELTALGLELGGISEEPSNIYGVGKVVRTDPPLGTTVQEGDSISLIVSQGPLAEAELVTFTLNVTVPDGPPQQLVEVWVVSAENEQRVFQERLAPGKKVSLSLKARPQNKVRVDLDGDTWKEFPVSAGSGT
jgi:beta-lactam-binding protein with PASTA domain/tRNA A-37 threonylcarbamoyl transferase component Bud32